MNREVVEIIIAIFAVLIVLYLLDDINKLRVHIMHGGREFKELQRKVAYLTKETQRLNRETERLTRSLVSLAGNTQYNSEVIDHEILKTASELSSLSSRVSNLERV